MFFKTKTNQKYQCIKCKKKLSKEIFDKNKNYCDQCNQEAKSDIQITKLLDEYKYILNIDLKNLECKHVMPSKQRNIKKIIKNAQKANYPNIFWGYYRESSYETEWKTIDKMIQDNFMKAVRITITSDNHVWCDNTHTVISYLERGYKKLKDIPFYVVKFKNDEEYIYVMDFENSLSKDIEEIRGAVKNAKRLEFFIQNGGRKKCEWKIKNLYAQLLQNRT